MIRRMNMKKMNKILSVMMAAAMTVSMTACGGDTASDNTSASADNSAATTESAAAYFPNHTTLSNFVAG